jgi:dihydrolipoamide dehydrogenase
MAEQFDVVIIGGGPGGYVAAIRASQLGMKTAVMEREHMGGICLNWGCIPTKALLRASEINHLLAHAGDYGFKISGTVSFDIKKIVQRSRDVSAKLAGGVQGLMKKNKVTVINGHGKLNGKGKIIVRKSAERDAEKVADVEAKHIIIATGARARTLPGLEPDGKLVWSYKEAMVPDAFPKSLLVVGSGAIGIEFASFYKNLGADVTVVEVMDRVVPAEDEEISKIAQKLFEQQGMKIITGTTVTKLDKGKNDVTATLKAKDGKETKLKVDRVIMAVGVVGNVENLGLEGTGVKVDRGQIQTNEWLETGEKGVYAIGDVAGAPWLAHKASHEGVICVEKIAGVPDVHPMKKHLIPGCTYCRPQIASIGLTEAKAKEKGIEVKVGRFPFGANGKAIALGETDGLIKTIFDAKTGELLGAHMIGAEVTEMIQGYGVAMGMEATEIDLMHSVFAHPTLSEMMHESVLSAYGKALHI